MISRGVSAMAGTATQMAVAMARHEISRRTPSIGNPFEHLSITCEQTTNNAAKQSRVLTR
jgi:hypothetical protein